MKSLLFWTFVFILELMNISCDDNEIIKSTVVPLKTKLKNILCHEIVLHPKLTDVIVWQSSKSMKELVPKDYSQGFIPFASNETYLVLTKKSEYILNLFYWIGIESPLDQNKETAEIAVILHHSISKMYCGHNLSIRLSREFETLESESFLHTISQISNTPYSQFGKDDIYRDTNFPQQGPNLYIIKGKVTTRVKQVPIGLQWVKPDICLLLKTGPCLEELSHVTIYCGDDTNERACRRTIMFGRRMIPMSEWEQIFRIEGRGSPKYQSLIEFLENKEFYNPIHLDLSNDHLKEADSFITAHDEAVKLIKISDEMEWNFVEHRPISNIHFEEQETYILDSNSIAGVFIYFDINSDINVKVCAIQVSEKYIHGEMLKLSRAIPMRIVYGVVHSIFDFEINVIDFPFDDNWFIELGQHW